MLVFQIGVLLVLLSGYTLAASVQNPASAESSKPNDVALEFVPLNATEPVTVNEKRDNDLILEDSHFWRQSALQQLKKTLSKAKKAKETAHFQKARNIILFVGDGMGITTVTAGRIYKGQKHNKRGEEESLVFDDFPNTGLVKTYNVNKQVPDSAGTATALFTGVKTDYGAIGMDITRSATNSEIGRLTSIMDWAQAAGKRTGVVTTTRITHATPAAAYAKIFHRDWECDSKVPPESAAAYSDIARQLVETAPGNKLNVIMGGGLSPMGAVNVNEKVTVNFNGDVESVCKRNDNRNLTEEWLKLDNNTTKRVFVQNRDDLFKVDFDEVDHLMGLFRNNHITYAISKEAGEPSLKEMVEAAIKVLDRNTDSNGFVLMVEGGRIDQAHHQNYAHAALQEVLELDMAVEAALELTDSDETLIMVTADHSHSVTLNGYPVRGNDILGFANKETVKTVYETITYANGPGYYSHLANDTPSDTVWIPLDTLTAEIRNSPTYRHMAMMPLADETHGGEDVAVFASGPGSSLIRGVVEQNYLAYVMSYAGCMGPAKGFDDSCKHLKSSATSRSYSIILLMASALSLVVIKMHQYFL